MKPVVRPSQAPANRVETDGLKVLIPRDRIARRLDDLAGELKAEYGDGELTLLVVLTGALVFVADLVRRLDMPVRIEVANVSSYPGAARQSEGASIELLKPAGLAGRRVLVADDILDTGATLSALLDEVRAAGPADVRTCVLLHKNRDRAPAPLQADYVGFDVPDAFVVGYGLDHDNLHRNLPDICVLPDARGRQHE